MRLKNSGQDDYAEQLKTRESKYETKKRIVQKRDFLDQVHVARHAVRGYPAVPIEHRGVTATLVHALLAQSAHMLRQPLRRRTARDARRCASSDARSIFVCKTSLET